MSKAQNTQTIETATTSTMKTIDVRFRKDGTTAEFSFEVPTTLDALVEYLGGDPDVVYEHALRSIKDQAKSKASGVLSQNGKTAADVAQVMIDYKPTPLGTRGKTEEDKAFEVLANLLANAPTEADKEAILERALKIAAQRTTS